MSSNVWVGATVVTQAEAERDIPKLLAVPAAKRFVSVEPMLGPVNLRRLGPTSPGGLVTSPLRGIRWPDLDDGGAITLHTGRLDLVICGGESGPNARPMHPDWVRSLRDQCRSAGVPFLFKQWGEWSPMTTTDGRQMLPFGDYQTTTAPYFGFAKRGKKAAGRMLDGREWMEFPGQIGLGCGEDTQA